MKPNQLIVNQRVQIKEDETNNVYIVHGIDKKLGRFWLGIEDEEYDGYDGDLILQHNRGTCYDMIMCDERTSFECGTLHVLPA